MPRTVHPLIKNHFDEQGIEQSESKRTKRRCRACRQIIKINHMDHLVLCQTVIESVREEARVYLNSKHEEKELEKCRIERVEFLSHISSKWHSLGSQFPSVVYGKRVLDALLDSEFGIRKPTDILAGWEASEWAKLPPTFTDIMTDAGRASKVEDITFYDSVSGATEAPIEGETDEAFLIRAKAQHISGLIGLHGNLPLLNAISIFGRTNQGIHRHSHLFHLPNEFHPSVYSTTTVLGMGITKPGEESLVVPKLNSICSPPGCITHPHTDGMVSGSLQVHISGTKLWFFWPPSPDNLLWLAENNDDSRPPDLLDAISNLKNLELMLLTPGYRMTMTPGTIHAVMSLDASAHTSLEVFSEAHFPLAKETTKWELGWLSSMARSGRGSLNSRVEHALEGLEVWNQLASQKSQERGRGSTTRRRKDGMALDIDQITRAYKALFT